MAVFVSIRGAGGRGRSCFGCLIPVVCPNLREFVEESSVFVVYIEYVGVLVGSGVCGEGGSGVRGGSRNNKSSV